MARNTLFYGAELVGQTTATTPINHLVNANAVEPHLQPNELEYLKKNLLGGALYADMVANQNLTPYNP